MPYNYELEEGFLGSILLDGNLLRVACGLVDKGDFYSPTNAEIFGAMEEVAKENSSVDLVVLWAKVQEMGLQNRVALSDLTHIASGVGSSVRYATYAKKIRELAYFRKCIAVGQELIQAGAKQDIAKVTQEMERLKDVGGGAIDVEDVATITKNKIADTIERQRLGNRFAGIPTKFMDVDLMLGGLCKDNLYILAARPSMGKTALALDVIRGVADGLQENQVILFFSLEMGSGDIGIRLYCQETGTPNQSFALSGGKKEVERFAKELEEEKGFYAGKMKQVYVDDRSALGVDDIAGVCHKMRSDGKEIALVVIDYLQLLTGKGENRTQEVSGISRGLKNLAKDFSVPVVALSQLSRSLESRSDKRPMLSDLRESGTIEQDADAVMFLYRDEYYYPDSEKKGQAELIVAKQRNGPIGTAYLTWRGECTSFKSWTAARAEGFTEVHPQMKLNCPF